MADTATWAKAPSFANQREVAERLHAETEADKLLYTTAGLQPVDCGTCGTRVLVKKNSKQHTSIQWTTRAKESCPELRAGTSTGSMTALPDTCPRLRASISYAVAEGMLQVGDPDGEAGNRSDSD
ncbi:hypothetical protein [Rhodococcus sp. X156]|uniref:hypothetical protein n=1 Tax=Rhodococcus sp. X156 TaxID=2499145 RepID=UPI000FD783A9|nr:hypothetical protein [Rhodococcus sp. X156]